jgi:dienelactone hydrolase
MKLQFIAVAFLSFSTALSAQKVIPLEAKGSESWNWNETETFNNMIKLKLVYNVAHPTLTVFLPDSVVDNGTAVVICPGGGFHFLSIENEGFEVARWLTKKGITAFVLKYRLVHCLTDNPMQEFTDKKPGSPKFNQDIEPVVGMDITDGENALAYVRQHAAEYKIDPKRIGLMGFSAGGTVTAGVAYNYTPETRPDFVAPIYPYVGSFIKTSVQTDAPPLFTVVAADDYFGFDKDCIDLYKDWIASKHSAELHIYAKGGHGFGMGKKNLPTDNWIERFADWLGQQGFLKK